MKKKTVVIAVIVLLVLLVGYIAVNKYLDTQEADKADLQALSINQGYSYAVVEIMTKAAKCDILTLVNNNVSVRIIAIDCIEEYI